MSEEIRTEEKARQEQAERAHVIVLKKPHTWEQKEYTEIDLCRLSFPCVCSHRASLSICVLVGR